MAVPATPQNYFVQTANAQVLLSWDISLSSTSYLIQRSTDNVTFAPLGTTASNQYLDTAVVIGTQYWYKVAASNSDGTSAYTASQFAVPTITGEMCLGQIRLLSQQRADRVNSQFVTLPEWNSFINLALFELYDLLVTLYEDNFVAPAVTFQTDGSTFLYPLPNGVTTFTGPNGYPLVARPFYKLMGVDLNVNSANNAWVTINKFNFIDRNKFVYPNTAGTIYGVFNCQYRTIGNKIEFIPTPSAGQNIRLWYVPRMTQLLLDTDITDDLGVSGWLQYVVVRAAKYALDKEESDTAKLDDELRFLKERIEASGMNRDAGQPDRISNTRPGDFGQGNWGGQNGGIGGF